MMRFTKMHGLGNDYVYVDTFTQTAPPNPAELSRIVSDRHRGVGSDGLILIMPSTVADARMRIFNADGSEGGMCGNGIRCVAKYLFDRGLARKSVLAIETAAGVRTLELRTTNGRVETVRVDVGAPILEAANIPTLLSGDPPIDQLVDVCGQSLAVCAVSNGNPHAIIFDPAMLVRGSKIDFVAEFGPVLEHHELFPQRTNVHFVRVDNRAELTMRTWERGSGMTQACGTGACAVCVAGHLSGRTERKILAHLPGGDLELDWSEKDNHVYMTGPATEVFSGEWPD